VEKTFNIEYFYIENVFKLKVKVMEEFGHVLHNVRKPSMSKI
jgi:hypothetical protein